MAYVRHKFIRGYGPYWYLVRSQRFGPGSAVRQIHIAYIGKDEGLARDLLQKYENEGKVPEWANDLKKPSRDVPTGKILTDPEKKGRYGQQYYKLNLLDKLDKSDRRLRKNRYPVYYAGNIGTTKIYMSEDADPRSLELVENGYNEFTTGQQRGIKYIEMRKETGWHGSMPLNGEYEMFRGNIRMFHVNGYAKALEKGYDIQPKFNGTFLHEAGHDTFSRLWTKAGKEKKAYEKSGGPKKTLDEQFDVDVAPASHHFERIMVHTIEEHGITEYSESYRKVHRKTLGQQMGVATYANENLAEAYAVFSEGRTERQNLLKPGDARENHPKTYRTWLEIRKLDNSGYLDE
jgi:hypothetical protein